MSVVLVGPTKTRMSDSDENFILSRVGTLSTTFHNLPILRAFKTVNSGMLV